MSTRHARTADKALNEKHTRILKELLQKPFNRFCADCKRKDPRWASWNLGVFVCIRCSGIHRSLGTHISKVKSVDLDTWIPNQVESMIKWGNERANKYWEANLQDRKPVESNMEMWIRGKYEQKRWAMKGPIPDPSTLGGEEVQTPAKPVSTPPAQQAAPPAAPKTKQSELSNLDAFFGSSSSGTQPSTASKLQGEDFFFSSSTPTTTTNSTPAPKVEKPQQDDFKSSILSLYSQTPSNPSMQTHIAGGYANNMTNYQNQLSGLTMGMPPSGVIPQAPPGQANMYQNVWNSFGNNPVANGGGFAPQPQQPQQPANSLPQGSQFFAMNSQPVEKKPAYDAFADLLK